KEIPIIPVVGPERFVRSGNKVRRVIESRVRLARDGQQLFDYYVTTEAEIIGMTPKIPWLGYEGQFETQTPWNDLHKVPRAYAEVKATTEEVPSQLLPLPQRQGYEPPVEALEIGKESVRRSIQATVASYGVTRLDDTNVKSGVALKQLEKQNDLGSYHFIDNYKIALRRVGRILNDLLDDVEGGEEELQVGIRKQDDSHEVVNINGPDGQKYRLSDKDQHQVTISTGASFQTQREEAATVADSLIANIQQLPLTPPQAAKVLALILKLKQLGPIGDQMIEIIDPSEKDQEDPEAMKQQRDQAAQMVQAMGEQLNALIQEREGKKAELESRERVAQLQVEVEKLKIEADLEKTRAKTMVDNESRLEIQRLQSQTRLAVAEINTRAQELSERMALISDLFKEYGIQQHKIDMEGRKQAHEAGLAAQQRLLAGEMADRKVAEAAQNVP
ncbi:MAG: portal protein, partial [Candidatus Glassbacteria bacterium]